MNVKHLKISTQLLLSFTLMIIFVMILGSISLFQSNEIHTQTETLYNHPLQVRKIIGALETNIETITLGVSEIRLADSEDAGRSAVELIQLADVKCTAQMEKLYELYLGPSEDVDSLIEAYSVWKIDFVKAVNMVLNGETSQAKEFLVHSEFNTIHKNTLISKIDVIDNFASGKEDSLYFTSVQLNKSVKNQMLIALMVIIVLTMLISYWLIRNIRRPIQELIKVTDKFQEGEMSIRSTYDRRNEFGVLSEAYNKFAQSIQSSQIHEVKIAKLAEVMLKEDEQRQFFIKTITILAELCNAQMAAIYLHNESDNSFEHYYSIGFNENARRTFSAETPDGEFDLAITSKKMQFISDLPDDTRFLFNTVSGSFIPRSMITIPIVRGGSVIAVISLAKMEGFETEAVKLMDDLTDILSVRIESILSFEKIKVFSSALERQNRELDAQKVELSVQAFELTQQNSSLEYQKKKINEASQLKTNFLSNMSHELRTPLNSVIALSGVLNRRLKGQIPEDEYGYLEVIERNGKNLLALINDILDISRIEAGKEEIELREFDVNSVISDIVAMMQPQLMHKDIRLIQVDNTKQILTKSDERKYRHILQNLISNAVKFTDAGNVTVAASVQGESVIISVTDTGIGIAKEKLSHIFEEFRQADESTSRRFGGSGLGLAIAQKYAVLLGGSIRCESKIGIGSEFIVMIPIEFNEIDSTRDYDSIELTKPMNRQESLAYMKKEVSSSLMSEKTILVVEDSEPAIVQIKDLLETMGYKIVIADNADDALKIIEYLIPDAMILDLMMPETDGFELLEILRNEDKTALIPVLILTAKHITKDDLRNLKRNNVYQLIQKGDVNRLELQNAINEMVYPKAVSKKKPEATLNLQVAKQPVDRQKPCVLVVEDNPDNMLTVRAILEEQFIVIEAVDGQMGIDKSKEYIPDLILMDIALPGINGIEAFKEIRRSRMTEYIPVIALTASAMISDRELILSHGFDAFISKPIIVENFIEIIMGVLYGK